MGRTASLTHQISGFFYGLGRGFIPANAKISPKEAFRAGFGALIGLSIVQLILVLPVFDPRFGLILIGPFGASAVLLFGVPNSPLAQPWPAFVGSLVSALVGVSVCLLVPEPILRAGLAVALAIGVMIVTRSLHPPGGAIALTAALNPEIIQDIGYQYTMVPVGGTVILVFVAALYAGLTGRRYPLRQFDGENDHGTADAPSLGRLGLSEAELNDILQHYRQAMNLGAEDLGRLIGAAQLQAASHRTGPMTAADIMSRDLVTVEADTRLSAVADLFRTHGFTSLPVVTPDDTYLGMIFQIHLIRRAREDDLRLDRGFAAAMTRLMTSDKKSTVQAGDIMAVAPPSVTVQTPLGAVMPLLAKGNCDAVPVLSEGRLVGIVTRTDLIAALAKESLRQR